jgi:hypothetical protein
MMRGVIDMEPSMRRADLLAPQPPPVALYAAARLHDRDSAPLVALVALGLVRKRALQLQALCRFLYAISARWYAHRAGSMVGCRNAAAA